MEGSGPSFRKKKPSSFTSFHGPLEIIKQQRIIKELPSLVPRLGDIWIPLEVKVESFCIQFYNHELDHKIQVGDMIIRIVFSSKYTHILC
jgi:hypothetical protein